MPRPNTDEDVKRAIEEADRIGLYGVKEILSAMLPPEDKGHIVNGGKTVPFIEDTKEIRSLLHRIYFEEHGNSWENLISCFNKLLAEKYGEGK